jgi:hypothetical protein
MSEYKKGFEVGLAAGRAEALAELNPMTKEQEDTIYAAYMGISVLSTMCKKAGLNMGRARSEELLQELAEAFPEVYKRSLLSALR